MDKESALFYVVLILFAITGIVTILGLVQKVMIEKKYLNALFSALILELIAAVLYLFSNTEFFPTPNSLTGNRTSTNCWCSVPNCRRHSGISRPAN